MVEEHWICNKFGQIGNSKQLPFRPNFCLIWPQMSNFGTFPVIQLVENDVGQYCYHLKVIPRNTKDSGSIKLHRAGLIWPQNPHFGVFANIRFAEDDTRQYYSSLDSASIQYEWLDFD